jgi:hypothetical protein
MHILRVLTVGFILAAGAAGDEPAPEWAKRTFAAPPDSVFAAALKSIAVQKHEVKSKDEANRTVNFHVGTTAWSWGYNMILKVESADNKSSSVSIDIARSGGKTVSWGSGKKEVLKIFDGIEKELGRAAGGDSK